LAESLPYYVRRSHSRTLVADGERLTGLADLPRRLRDPHVRVWAALVNREDPDGIRKQHLIGDVSLYTDLRRYSDPDLEVTSYVGVSVVRVRRAGQQPIEQMTILLQWAARFEPALTAQLGHLLANQSLFKGEVRAE
jgi:hypothetical protein